jgi:phosphatidylglycerol:prolipoprotein diacylglycerol transferase
MDSYTWWNTLPSKIDPTFLTIGGDPFITLGSNPGGGGFPIQFYGLSYIMVFLTTYLVIKHLQKKESLPFTNKQFEDLLFYGILGVLIGARLGYVLFYNFPHYAENPMEIFMPLRNGEFVGISGMSFHGGLIGVIISTWIYIRKEKLPYMKTMNIIAYAFPLGYTWGRIGNFLNGELYGRPTDAWIGMVFPNDPDKLLRHPSQLYEAFLEGLLLFGVLTLLRKKAYFRDKMVALYIAGYGIARFIAEFFREPDSHLGLNFLNISRGQTFSLLMILLGISIIIYQHRKSQATYIK